MSTIADNTADTLHFVGGRVHDVTSSIPANLLPSGVEWPTDLVDRVTDDLADGLECARRCDRARNNGRRGCRDTGRGCRWALRATPSGARRWRCGWSGRRDRLVRSTSADADTAAVVPRAANGAGAVDAA